VGREPLIGIVRLGDSVLDAIVRILIWLPAAAWLGIAVAVLWMSTAVIGPEPDLKDAAVSLGFVASAICFLRMAWNELGEARAEFARASLASPRRDLAAVPSPGSARPMQALLRAELLRLIGALRAAGILEPAEVSSEEIIECAERLDDFVVMDPAEVLHILRALREERDQPFAHLAFFSDQVETTADDPLDMVHELARISGCSGLLCSARFSMTGEIVSRGKHPPPNALVEFNVEGHAHAIPFVMYSKNAPIGLIEGLAKVLTRSSDRRRFFWAGFDDLHIVVFQSPENIAALNSQLAPEPTWMPVQMPDAAPFDSDPSVV